VRDAGNPAADGPLRLRIPELTPHERGPAWDRALHLSRAGEVRRPDVDEDIHDLAALGEQLVRVLDDDGTAVGPWAGTLSPAELTAGLRDMLLVRSFDRQMLLAQRQGKSSFYMQCLGEEAVACAHRRALRDGDMSFPTYRQQGLLVAGGYPLVLMMNQVLSNSGDPLRGRQLPVMYSSRAHGFFTISGNLATQFVQAVGWAMASAIAGGSAIASAWIGEGATAESDFHAGLVFASTYQAPVILNVVNNQWAISTPEDFARGAAATFADRGLGFGIPSLRVDGNDFLAVHAVSEWAAARARTNRGPTLVEWVTYRVGAHSTSDDPRGYRASTEAEAWPLGDPIDRLRAHLASIGAWDDERHVALEEEVDRTIADAFTEAESYGYAKGGLISNPATMFDDVYAVMPRHLREQREQMGY
jgi:2-oxoisovalerate dehydrogenase E1 component alpha subunit